MGNTPRTAMAKLAAVQAEVEAVGAVSINIRSEVIEVKPFGDWPVDALEDLNDSKFRSWAEQCLTARGWEVWQELKPTMNEITPFFAEYNKATGQDLGK